MNTNSLKQQQILGGHETNAEMWNSPYSDTGSTDGTVAGNSINGSLDRTANYIDSFLEAEKPVNKLMKKGGLGIFGCIGAAVGFGLIKGNEETIAGAIGSAGYSVILTAIAFLALASLAIGVVKLIESQKVAKITDEQRKELQKQAQQNITLASTNAEKEFKYKQQMAEQNLMTTSNINDAKNQSRRKAANAALLEQDLHYANLGHNLATAMESFSDIDADTMQDAKKNLQQVKLFGLEASRIDKSFGGGLPTG